MDGTMIQKHKGKIIMSIIVLAYVSSYCCLYTSYITFNLANSLGINAEYASAESDRNKYSHSYVIINEIELFKNPFKEYAESDFKTKNNKEFISSCTNWGQLYIPGFDVFVDVF